jgi:hypothetical protein
MSVGVLILVWYPHKGKYLQDVQSKAIEMHAENKQRLEQKEQG